MRGIRHEPIAPVRAALLALLTLSAWALAASVAHAQERGPLVLAKASYFFVGGKIDTSLEGSPMVGHMYVESMIPQRQRHPYPIVMVHGGSQTGTNFTGTPDGREGWAQYFVRRGYAVYVVDQPGRGRSGYLADAYGPWRVADGEGAQRRYLSQAKFKLWPQAHLHTQWPGSGAPDDPVTLRMVSGFLPEIADFTKQQFLIRRPAPSAGRWRMRGRTRSKPSWRSSRTGRPSTKSNSSVRRITSSRGRWRSPTASPRCR